MEPTRGTLARGSNSWKQLVAPTRVTWTKHYLVEPTPGTSQTINQPINQPTNLGLFTWAYLFGLPSLLSCLEKLLSLLTKKPKKGNKKRTKQGNQKKEPKKGTEKRNQKKKPNKGTKKRKQKKEAKKRSKKGTNWPPREPKKEPIDPQRNQKRNQTTAKKEPIDPKGTKKGTN